MDTYASLGGILLADNESLIKKRWLTARRGYSFVALLVSTAIVFIPILHESSGHVLSATTPQPMELLISPNDMTGPDGSLHTNQASWFASWTGNTMGGPGGVFAIAGSDTILYLGYGTSLPTIDTGAMVAQYDGIRAQIISDHSGDPLRQMTEQGIYEMDMVGDTLFVPGVDPATPDGKEAGTLYRYNDTDGWNKQRFEYPDMHYVDSTTTDEEGIYQFDGVKPGAYYVKFIPPVGYGISMLTTGDGGNDNDADPQTGTALSCGGNPFNLSDGFVDNGRQAAMHLSATQSGILGTLGTRDESYFGYQGTIGGPASGTEDGGLVWHDVNEDGQLDPEEIPIADVRVELWTKGAHFPCTIHSYSFWHDPMDDSLYMLSAVEGLYHYYVSRSTDMGASWKFAHGQVPNTANGIWGVGPRLYTSAGTTTLSRQFYYSDDTGQTWQRLSTGRPHPAGGTRMVSYQDMLLTWEYAPQAGLGLTQDEHGLVTVDESGTVAAYKLPLVDGSATRRWLIDATSYQNITVAHDRYVYALVQSEYPTTGGTQYKVLMSDGLQDSGDMPLSMSHWSEAALLPAGQVPMSIYYWAAANKVVVATKGPGGGVYVFDHVQTSGPPPLLGDVDGDADVDWLDMANVIGAYTSTGTQSADINGDLIVNGFDVGMLMQWFGTTF